MGQIHQPKPDEVTEYANVAAFPATWVTGKIYVDISTTPATFYRWNGSAYAQAGSAGAPDWWDIWGTLANQTDLQAALDLKANDADVVHNTWAENIGGPKTFTSTPLFSTMTQGSVLFAGAAGILSQSNQNFYFNTASNRLSLFSWLWSEVVTNGTFTGSATGWTVGSGYAYSSNTVVHSSNWTATLQQSLSVSHMREYLLTYTISGWTVGSVTPSVTGYTGTAVSANWTYQERFVASAATITLAFTPTNTARFTIDNVSVKPLIGTSQASNLNVGGLSIEGSWSNGSPNTTRALTFNNDGSNTWTDYRFAWVLRGAYGFNSSGGSDTYTTGGNGAAYYTSNAGLTSSTLYSFNFPTYFYHTGDLRAVWHGMFGGKVGAGTGSGTTPTSTLMSAGGLSLKPRRCTTNTTLDDTAYFWIGDATNPSCNGTPSVTACSTYTASWQSVCESHLPCAWFAGYDCSAFNSESGMGTCSGTSWCTAETAACSGGDETTCLANDDSYGGSCAWSWNDCSGFNEWACTPSGCTPNYSDCSSFNGNESGCTWQSGCSINTSNTCPAQMDEWSCVGAGCSWDWMTCTGDNSTCTGTYFTGCTGTYYSCTGTYYTGNCTGMYWMACSGTATCGGYGSSGACTWEAWCSWVTAITFTLPDSAVLPNYSCAIYNGSSTGADVNIVAPTGHTVDVSVLSAYKDSVILQWFNDVRQCSDFASAGACTPTWCTANYSACSWDSWTNTCSWNAVCVGLGDQWTCEATTYFSSCSWTWYASKHYYRLAS